jgi:hypothetical protein
MIVNGHMSHFPADTINRAAPIAGNPAAGTFDAAELLGIQVQHLARAPRS